MPARRKASDGPKKKPLDPVAKGVGEHIKKLREAEGLTQVQLGKKVGIAQARLSTYEKGRRVTPYAVLYRLAVFFNVCPGEFYGYQHD